MTARGFEVRFKKNDAIIIDEKNKIHCVGNPYHIRISQNDANNIEVEKKPLGIWFERLGHLNKR